MVIDYDYRLVDNYPTRIPLYRLQGGGGALFREKIVEMCAKKLHGESMSGGFGPRFFFKNGVRNHQVKLAQVQCHYVTMVFVGDRSN